MCLETTITYSRCAASFSHTIICLQHASNTHTETTSKSCPNYRQQIHHSSGGGGCDCNNEAAGRHMECVYKHINNARSFSFEENASGDSAGDIEYLQWRGYLGYGRRWKAEVQRLTGGEAERVAAQVGSTQRETLRWVVAKEAPDVKMDIGANHGTDATGERGYGVEEDDMADAVAEDIRRQPKEGMHGIKMEQDEEASSGLAVAYMTGLVGDKMVDVKVEDDADEYQTNDLLRTLPTMKHPKTAVEWDLLMDATRRHSWEGLKTERLKAEKRRWVSLRNRACARKRDGDPRDLNEIVLELYEGTKHQPPPPRRSHKAKSPARKNPQNRRGSQSLRGQ